MVVPALHSEKLHVSCTGLHSRFMDSGESSAQRGAGSERGFVWYSTPESAKGRGSHEDREMEKEVAKEGVICSS